MALGHELLISYVLTRDQSFTSHPHIYLQVEKAIPAFTPQPQSINALLAGIHFPSHWG